MRCGAECSMLGWLMQHAAVAVAPRCADEVNNFDIPFHEIYLPLPSILVFVPTNSSSCFHESCRSFPRIRFPASIKSGIRSHQFKFLFPRILSFLSANSDSRFHQFRYSFPSIQIPVSTDVVIPFHEFGFSLSPILLFLSTNSNSRFYEFNFPLLRILIFLPTNSTPHSHEFQHSLPPIQTFLSTNVGKQKRHPFVGMSFSIAFPLSGGAWRIRTAVDGFADR